ncbi:glycosyltransferase [Desulforamulus aeronauticus]|uniref:TPR repeat-containing protein n=1 Tax=Desulforamulus aeronauticus DSM 10349 TaxID=1121421 RepID=A0A1M6RE05_9FIRM|nr:glycosyltransferase [Desulforamulus aeronauticus]SHK30653.1 TPR repeat-containing protein [Desulforamulus aeronauticus DSM 10349]
MRLSACSIVKNEAKNIARSIESYKDVVDEIIIVDTGSTDNTVEICQSLGAKVLHFEWINDFAAAKNYALQHAQGEWILFLDADEWFVPKLNDDRIFKVLDKVEKLPDVVAIKTTLCNIDETTGFISTKNSCARILKNGSGVHYVGKIHEDIRRNGQPVHTATLEELEIYHCGYAQGRVVGKSHRNLEILYDIYRTGKADTATYFYLCRENALINNYSEALKFYELFFRQKNCEQVILSANIFVSIYEHGIDIKQNNMDRFTFQDILTDIESAIEKYPDIPSHYHLKALHYYNFGFDFDQALELFEKAISLHKEYKGPYINSFAKSLPEAYWYMAQIYRAKHKQDKAFDYLVLSLQEKPLQDGSFQELLQLIRNQSDEDVILFLNSLYDSKNRDHVGFLAKQLMLSRLHTVFLYYAMKYNQEFDGQDETTYVAMILANQEEAAVETAMTAYFNAGKEDDRYFAALAMLCKKRIDLYEKYRSSLNPAFSTILNKYLHDQPLEQTSKEEIAAFLQLYRYMFYVGQADDLAKLESFFAEQPMEVAAGIMECYVSYKDHTKTIALAQKCLQDFKSEHFKTQMKKLLAFSYYLVKDYANAVDCFKTALESKDIDIDRNIVTYLRLISEASQDNLISLKAQKLYDKYAPIFKEYRAFADMVRTGKVRDISTTDDLKKIQELNQETFGQLTKPDAVKLPELVLNNFFALVEEYVEKDLDISAHVIILRLLKQEFKKDILYYRLGEIYTRLQNPDMSLYCHEQVFIVNATFAETLLTDPSNENRHYIYQPVEGIQVENCPLCGSFAKLHAVYNTITNPEFSSKQSAIKAWRYCISCNHLFAAQRPKEVSYELAEEKASSMIKGMAKELIHYQDTVSEICSLAKGNLFLDIGSGSGKLIAVALEYGFEAVGIEPIEQLALQSQKTLDTTIYNCTLENFESNTRYDVISLDCVLENLAEPQTVLGKIEELLNKDGLLYIETPNFASAYARVMKDKSWTVRSGRIVNYFSKQSLERLLTEHGFTLINYRMSKRNNGYMEVFARKC